MPAPLTAGSSRICILIVALAVSRAGFVNEVRASLHVLIRSLARRRALPAGLVTVETCQLPPPRVKIPRPFSSVARARRLVAPPARMSFTTARRSSACRSAFRAIASRSGAPPFPERQQERRVSRQPVELGDEQRRAGDLGERQTAANRAGSATRRLARARQLRVLSTRLKRRLNLWLTRLGTLAELQSAFGGRPLIINDVVALMFTGPKIQCRGEVGLVGTSG